jgi:hypothetical protein
MVPAQEQRLFAPSKIEWLLDGGLETMDAAERQILLVMAETQIQDGYKPTNEEKNVVDKLCALAGEDYDAKDIKRKVQAMVKGHSKPDAAPMRLPPVFHRLIKRFLQTGKDPKR